MPETPSIGDRYVNSNGILLQVISTHPPYITARRRRGWAATVVTEDGHMYLVEMSSLEKGGFELLRAPHAAA